jgi:tetratricopeptide (TPR) repeat protein
VRDNHNCVVWGLLVLLCVKGDPPRHAEAAAALGQALKHGLAVPRNGALLRELVGAYAELGKAGIAQQLLRRVLAAQVEEGDHGAQLEVAWAQHALGVLLVQDGTVEEGIAHLSSVLRAANDLGDGELEAATARDLANALRSAGHVEDAQAVEAEFLE